MEGASKSCSLRLIAFLKWSTHWKRKKMPTDGDHVELHSASSIQPPAPAYIPQVLSHNFPLPSAMNRRWDVAGNWEFFSRWSLFIFSHAFSCRLSFGHFISNCIFSHNRLLLWSHQPLQHTNSGYICNLPRLNVDKTKISGWKYVCKHVTESASTLWPSNRGPFSQSVNSERNHHIFLGKGKRKYCILQNTWT